MKKILTATLLSMVSCIAFSQGIRFENIKIWENVVDTAKMKHKYIFVDCYASWCQPCREMESKVFTSESLGSFMNEEFISIKMQMDLKQSDSTLDVSKYATSKKFEVAYKINSFPTYLIFSPDGKLVDKIIGAYNTVPFAIKVANSINPEKQPYKKFADYESGKKDFKELGNLSLKAKELSESKLATKIAQDYIDEYLLNLPESNRFTRKNIQYIVSFPTLLTSSSKSFAAFTRYDNIIDSTMGIKNYTRSIIKYVITKEEVDPYIKFAEKNGLNPSWNKLYREIARKYDTTFAQDIILNSKFNWFYRNKDWKQAIRYQAQILDRTGIDMVGGNWIYINNLLESLFLRRCDDKTILKKAVKWMEVIVERHPDPGVTDIYAGLLYKTGNRKEAVKWMQLTVDKNNVAAKKENGEPIPFFSQNLQKMTEGRPWNEISQYLKYLDK